MNDIKLERTQIDCFFCDVSTAAVVVEVVVTPYKRCREASGRLGPGNEASVACLVPRLPQQQVDRAKK